MVWLLGGGIVVVSRVVVVVVADVSGSWTTVVQEDKTNAANAGTSINILFIGSGLVFETNSSQVPLPDVLKTRRTPGPGLMHFTPTSILSLRERRTR